MEHSNGLITIRGRGAARWVVGLGACAGLLGLAFVSTRWALAETALRFVPNADVIVAARDYEPGNAQAPYMLGVRYLDGAKPDPALALENLEQAVALSPNDFKYWLALGRARERAGDAPGAEAAFRRSETLAPADWQPVWLLGNFYVRQGRLGEALPRLRSAGDRKPDLPMQAIKIVWLASNRNVGTTAQVVGESPSFRGLWVDFLASEKLYDEAVSAWLELVGAGALTPQAEAKGRALAESLLAANRADLAAAVWARVDPNRAPARGSLRNAGFESPLIGGPPSPFDWIIGQTPGGRVALAGPGHSGDAALQIVYDDAGGHTFAHAAQSVLVDAGASYEVRAWVKAESLTTGGPAALAVSDGATKARLSQVSLPTASTADWREVRMVFTAPTSGVATVAIVREACGESCPIFGTLWIDDVSLGRVAK